MQQQQQQQQNDEASLLSELANKDIGDVSDKDLQDLLSEQDLGSFAESLLKQIQADVGDIGKFWCSKLPKQYEIIDVKFLLLNLPPYFSKDCHEFR